VSYLTLNDLGLPPGWTRTSWRGAPVQTGGTWTQGPTFTAASPVFKGKPTADKVAAVTATLKRQLDQKTSAWFKGKGLGETDAAPQAAAVAPHRRKSLCSHLLEWLDEATWCEALTAGFAFGGIVLLADMAFRDSDCE